MSITIQTNLASITSQADLRKSNLTSADATKRLSSGSKSIVLKMILQICRSHINLPLRSIVLIGGIEIHQKVRL